MIAVAFMNTGGRQVQMSKHRKWVSTLSQKEGSPVGEAEMRPVHGDVQTLRRYVKVHAQPTTEKGQRVRTAVVEWGRPPEGSTFTSLDDPFMGGQNRRAGYVGEPLFKATTNTTHQCFMC